ncbi:hypothetical protein [Nitrosomonas sp.]|uniref:hypothetical protein n=1 Tax=Nitrosomonas sp. TaxID=42353 RepID=UPI00283B4951|nr:hypothetical protein [Nitrosomonas sp.]MCP5292425.1 hypothetical protein [Burkholderiales bacterium]MDR4515624.1 hypothetical protein [Nitrosomonas sp.]
MKTLTAQNFSVIASFAFLLITLPASSSAASQGATLNNKADVDHIALAQYYKNQVDEMQVKIEEQIEALSHKPRTSFFGRNGRNIKKHVEYKIHQYEIAIEENLKKATYHQQVAAEQSHNPASASLTQSGNTRS